MRYLLVFLAVCAALWGAQILPAAYITYKYRPLTLAIQQQKPIENTTLENAIKDYRAVSPFTFCYADFYRELSVFYMMRFATLDTQHEITQQEGILSDAMDAIDHHLHCQLKDANGWLNKAFIQVYQSGFNNDALNAYKKSVRTAPREAWLAEKRTRFALDFFPLFDHEAQSMAIGDVETLKTSFTSRRRRILEQTGAESLEALQNAMKEATTTNLN